jgi:hypothetical protein
MPEKLNGQRQARHGSRHGQHAPANFSGYALPGNADRQRRQHEYIRVLEPSIMLSRSGGEGAAPFVIHGANDARSPGAGGCPS